MPWEDPDPTPPADQPTVVWTPPDTPRPDAAPPGAPASTDPTTGTTATSPDVGAGQPSPTTDLWRDRACRAHRTRRGCRRGVECALRRHARRPGRGLRHRRHRLPARRVAARRVDRRRIGVVIGTLLIVVSGLTTAGDAVLVSTGLSVVILAIDFVYLVGFWTGPRRATPGMRLLALEIVDATSGAALSVRAAVIRWLAFGVPLSLLAALPVIGEISSWVLVGWSVFLLMTTAMSPMNQGMHDRWAGSAVMRRAGASTNGAAIGCLVIAIVGVLVFIVLPIAFLIAAGPELEEILREIGEFDLSVPMDRSPDPSLGDEQLAA